jgi:hypothetical protein
MTSVPRNCWKRVLSFVRWVREAVGYGHDRHWRNIRTISTHNPTLLAAASSGSDLGQHGAHWLDWVVMALSPDIVGMTYVRPDHYVVGTEEIRPYAVAVKNEDAAYFDPDAVRALGHDAVLAATSGSIRFGRPLGWTFWCSRSASPTRMTRPSKRTSRHWPDAAHQRKASNPTPSERAHGRGGTARPARARSCRRNTVNHSHIRIWRPSFRASLSRRLPIYNGFPDHHGHGCWRRRRRLEMRPSRGRAGVGPRG